MTGQSHDGSEPPRRTRDVVESHLELRQRGDLERDLDLNYSPEVVLLSAEGVQHGHDGVRRLADVLQTYVDAGRYTYEQVLVDGEVAMLMWSAADQRVLIHDGADSYVVRDGLIQAQTIHYSVARRDRRS